MATITWVGNNATDAAWSRTDNWDLGRAPLANDDLHFAGSNRPSTNNDLTADLSFNSITFDSGAAAFTLAGNRITLAGTVTNSSTNSQTISFDMIEAAVRTYNCASGDILCSGIISGASGGISKTGDYTLILSNANTYAGTTGGTAGTLQLGNNGTTGKISTSSAITITSPCIFAIKRTNAVAQGTDFASVIGGTGTVQQSGSGTISMNGNNTFSGGFNIYGAGIVTAVTDNNAMGSGTITLGTGAVRFLITDGLTLPNSVVFNSGMTGGSGRGMIENTGSGNATLNGATMTVNAGPAGGTILASSASGAGSLTVNNVITTTGANTVAIRRGIVVFGGGGTGYTSLLISGTARVGASNGIATTATITIGVSAAGTLDLGGYNINVVGVVKGGNTATIGNSSTSADSILLTTGTYTYAGVIQDVLGSGSRKVSIDVYSGVATFTGANTFTGTIAVDDGAKIYYNGTSSGTGLVLAYIGSTFGGNGTLSGAFASASGAFVDPGASSGAVGALTTAQSTFDGTLQIDLDGSNPSNGKYVSTGAVYLATAGTSNIAVESVINAAPNVVYTVLECTAVHGTFTGKADGTIFSSGGRTWRINYTGTTVTLTDLGNWFLLQMKNELYNTMQNVNGMR